MKYLLDTDHISILQRQTGPEYTTLAAKLAPLAPGDAALPIISFHEQVLGCHTYIARAKTTADMVRGYTMLSRLLADYATMPVLPFDVAASAVLDGLPGSIRIWAMDLRIAAIALSRNLTILTKNVRDFGQVPGLVTEDWTA